MNWVLYAHQLTEYPTNNMNNPHYYMLVNTADQTLTQLNKKTKVERYLKQTYKLEGLKMFPSKTNVEYHDWIYIRTALCEC